MDAKRCGICQTDLSLFEVAGPTSDVADSHVSDGRTIDEILASITGESARQPDIFETLKSVAKSSHSADDVLVGEKRSSAEAETKVAAQHFMCPVCETSVAADASVCPGCGAQFAEGEATEFECPVCKASVAGDAPACPSCGVRFATEGEAASGGIDLDTPAAAPAAPTASVPVAEPHPAAPRGTPPATPDSFAKLKDRLSAVHQAKKEAKRELPLGDRKLMYRELPRLVNDVKALLLSAKKVGLQIESEKRLINEAIQAGKGHDVEKAVRMINEAKRALDVAFAHHLTAQIEAFVQEVRSAGAKETAAVDAPLHEAVDLLESGNYEGSWERLQAAMKGFQAQAKDYHEARDTLGEGEQLVAEVKTLNMDVRDVERLLRQAREAMQRRDQAGAIRFATQARARLDRDIPDFVQSEMKRARNTLLELKMRGGDLSKPIGILKVASVHMKKLEWREAVRYLREFRREVDSL